MSEFLKLGENIIVKPKGSDYDLINGKVYDLSYDRFEGPKLKENGELNLPSKIYKSKKDEVFIERVLNYHKSSDKNTTGVMMAGIKGTGKTIMAKVLAKESNLPIIIISSDFPASRLLPYFKKFKQEVCIILDEVEKNYCTEDLLGFLDGVEKTCKKLVLMTCNNISEVNEYMQDRCSRIRYLRKYRNDANLEFLPMIVEDLKIKNPEKVIEFCKKEIKLLSIDNIFAFLQEIKLLEDTNDNLDDIISILNIDTYSNIDISTTSNKNTNTENKKLNNFIKDMNIDYDCCEAA